MCDQAANRASKARNVPLDVLQAISLTETGRKSGGSVRPWPWTVNMEGRGRWFDTESEARAYVDGHFQRGARSFDVGCFQINYRWHGQHFDSVDAMFDPFINADYAARFLSELYAEYGDWGRAAGAYHSRTPDLAAKYRNRFERLRKVAARRIGQSDIAVAAAEPAAPIPPVAAPEERSPRKNSFPLLINTGQPSALGSLVPVGALRATKPLVPTG
jgi:hypothetical protein